MVPIEESEKTIAALEKAHGRVRCTIYLNVGHDAYDFAYTDPEFYTWLLEQVRGKPSQPQGVETIRVE